MKYLVIVIILVFIFMFLLNGKNEPRETFISGIENYQNSRTSSKFLTVPTYEPSWVYNWAYWNPFRYKYGYWPSYGIYPNTYKPYPHFLKYSYGMPKTLFEQPSADLYRSSGYFSPRKLFYV